MKENTGDKQNHNSLKDYFAIGEVFTYFFRKKKQQDGERNINLTLMHGINRIAIIIFLIALVIWLVKRLG
jgi:hypothetical protein